MKEKILGVLLIVVLLGGCSQPSVAGSYEIVKGKGVEVCDTYFDYLKKQTRPLTCNRDFPAGITNLKRPDWKQLDLNKNKLLILRIENYLQIPMNEQATQPWVPIIREENIDKFNVDMPGKLLYTANVDIDNDGKKENLAKYRSSFCWQYDNPDKEPRWKAPIVVLNNNGTNININKTYPLMQNKFKVYVSNVSEINDRNKRFFELREQGVPYDKRIKMVPVVESIMKPTVYSSGIAMQQGYDVFEFKKENYFDKWDEERYGNSFRMLTIYKDEKSKTESICSFHYKK